MEIHFCQRCQESIPDSEFEAGRAVSVDGQDVHVACALTRSLRLAGVRSWLVFGLALYAAGVATFLLVGALAGEEEQASVPVVVENHVAEVARSAEQRAVRRAEAAVAAMREEVDGGLRAALADQDEETSEALAAVRDRLLEGETAAREHVTSLQDRLGRLEGEVRALSDLVREAMTQAAAQAARPPAPVAPTPPREPDVAEAPSEPADGEMDEGEPERSAAEQARHDAEVDRWIRRLEDANENIRFSATLELGRLKDLRAAPALIGVLEDDRDYYVRLGAATALGDMRSVDAFLPLVEALDDSDALVRTAANDAIWAIVGELPLFAEEEAREPYHFVSEMSSSERRRVQRRWRDFFEEHEDTLRRHHDQPSG